MKNEDKIVLMDWGGVIESHLPGEYGFFGRTSAILKRFSNNSEVDYDKWITFYVDSKKYIISEVNNDDLIDKWISYIIKEFSLNCTNKEFLKAYQEEYSSIKYFDDIVEMLYETQKYCKIGILSNLNKLDKERLEKQIDLNRLDYVGLSFELGYIKPNEKIYECVEKETKIKPNNILFIDDNIDNIKEASNRGWNTLCATSKDKEKIKEKIEEFIN